MMTPWDDAYAEAHSIAMHQGAIDIEHHALVNAFAGALLAADAYEVELRAATVGEGMPFPEARGWDRLNDWERVEWREAARFVNAARIAPPLRKLKRTMVPPRYATMDYLQPRHTRDDYWERYSEQLRAIRERHHRRHAMMISQPPEGQFEGSKAFVLDPKYLPDDIPTE
jgi:hypothetical protein